MSKLTSVIYYAKRPIFRSYGIKRVRRIVSGSVDYDRYNRTASTWAAERAAPIEQDYDIQDNDGMRGFAGPLIWPFATTGSPGKYAGVIAKPAA